MSLSPDEYFIKPQLKEYEFNPKHKMQKLQQGENAHITWTAKRVAFSIHGKIVSLNGQAEPGTTLKGNYFSFVQSKIRIFLLNIGPAVHCKGRL